MPLTILADDLTGACDTGALFSGAGPVAVTVAPAIPEADREVWVIDTESRSLEPSAAGRRIAETLDLLPAGRRAGRIFKKIDSSFRGAVGAEVEALLKGISARTALVCPAFPRQGRTVVGGILRIDGQPVHATAVGADPDFRGAGSDLIDLLRAQVGRPVLRLPLDDIRHPGDLPRVLDRMAGACVLADAETEEDLDRLAEVALAAALPPLLAGSAGLAGPVAARLGYAKPPVAPPSRSDWFFVFGSLHPASHAQLHALEASGVDGARLHPDAPTPDAAVAHLLTLLRSGRPAFLATRLLVRSPGPGERRLAASVLAQTVARVLAEVRPGLLALVGGETSVAVYHAIKAEWIEVVGAPQPGLALGSLRGGAADGLPLLTKAGGFGPPDLFVSLLGGSRA